jgi:tetratricopeptide (TPR) repeat protein
MFPGRLFGVLALGGYLGWVVFDIPLCAQPQVSPLDEIQRLLQSSQEALLDAEYDLADSDLRWAGGIALEQLGAAYSRLRDWAKAEQAYREACRSSIVSIQPFLGLAIVYLRTGRYEPGMEILQQILGVNPTSVEAKHLLGKFHYLQGDFKGAVRELRDAYSLEPDNLSVAYTLALAHLELKELDEARKIFESLKEQAGESAGLHVLFGRAYRETNYWPLAVEEFRRAVELDPTYPRVHYYLGLTYLRWEGAAAFPRAREALLRELEHNPDEYLPNFYLGVILTMQQEDAAAEEYLRRAIRLAPENPDPYLYLGQVLNRKGLLEEAVQALEKSIELTESPARNNYQISNTHYVLGQILLRQGRRREAAEHLRKSQEFKRLQDEAAKQNFQSKLNVERTGATGAPTGPEAQLTAGMEELGSIQAEEVAVIVDEPPPQPEEARRLEQAIAEYRRLAAAVYEQRARLATQQGEFPTAATLLELAQSWDESLPGVSFNLALARIKAGQLEPAVSPLMKHLQANPRHEEAWDLLAHVGVKLLEARQGRAAVPVFELLTQRRPREASLWVMLGQAQAQAGKYDAALESFRQALELQPELPEVHYYSGMALIRQGRLNEAFEAFVQEVKRNPRHADALYHQAFILITQNRLEEAEPLLQQVLRLRPDYADAYYQLGKLQTDRRDMVRAVANLETASRLDPTKSHIYYQLSRAYNLAGRRDDAVKALEEYRRLKRIEEAVRDRKPLPGDSQDLSGGQDGDDS